MKKFLNNKKGFTLVELLAVIVILALIMSIAIYSISGILSSSRESAFKDTALSIINGTRQQLVLNNSLKPGYYYVYQSLLQSGGTQTPYGDTISYKTATSGNANQVGEYLEYADSATCSVNSQTYVKVEQTSGIFTYSICIGVTETGAGRYYMTETSEADLMGSSSDMIEGPTTTG